MIKIRNKRQSIVLFLFFIAMFAFMPTNLLSDRKIWMLASILLLLSTIYDMLNKKVKIYLYGCYCSYFLLIVYGIVSMMWSANNALTSNYLNTKFPFITLGVLCVAAYMDNQDNADHILRLAVIAACVAAIRFCYYTPWDNYSRGYFGILLDENTNYNNYMTPLSLAFVLASYYALQKKEKRMQVAMIFLAMVLLLGGSRKTIFLIPVAVLFFTTKRGNVKRVFKGGLLTFAILIIGYYAINNVPQLASVQESLYNAYKAYILGERTNLGNSTEGRIYLTRAAKEVWMNHPILGVGWNNFRYYNNLGVYAHNNYYEALASLGIIGFALYYFLHINALVGVYRTSGKHNSIESSKLTLGMILAMLFLEVGAMPIYSRETMMLYLITLAMYERMRGRSLIRLQIGE